MIIVGYSNGGNLAIRAMMTRTLPFKTALLFHPKTLGQSSSQNWRRTP
ncbi:hypothetical protein [Lacticaseibacillus camelliae]|nr:hypothetical protein [Lacticaseibacillus camelliae]